MEQRARIRDTELAYEIAGDGPPLVWFHGLASCREGDRDVIDALAERFTVLSYDARGHGRSAPVHDESRMTYPILADDAVALLDHVGWDRAVLAGASMGAATAARVAAIAPERAAALVMARPGAMGDDGAAPPWLQVLFAGGGHAIRAGGLDAAIAFLMSIPQAREQLEHDAARLDALRADWARHDPLSIAAALIGIPATSPLDAGVTAEMIRCPALVIPGNDLIHPADAGVAVAGMIAGCVLADPFDGLPRARETEDLVALITRFLAERVGVR